MFAPYVFPAVGAIADAEGGAVREDYVDGGVGWDRVCWLGVWGGKGVGVLGKGGGGWGVEAVDVAIVGEGPAAELGLVGGGVDLLII